MGEAELPDYSGVGSVSAQLKEYRRVDVFARPVLAAVPDPPPVVVPPPQPMTFDDFEGSADHFGEAVGFGYGAAVDRFVFFGPMKNGDSSVAMKFEGWGIQAGFGIALEHGKLSKRFTPYPVSPEYLADPPSGSRIR